MPVKAKKSTATRCRATNSEVILSRRVVKRDIRLGEILQELGLDKEMRLHPHADTLKEMRVTELLTGGEDVSRLAWQRSTAEKSSTAWTELPEEIHSVLFEYEEAHSSAARADLIVSTLLAGLCATGTIRHDELQDMLGRHLIGGA